MSMPEPITFETVTFPNKISQATLDRALDEITGYVKWTSFMSRDGLIYKVYGLRAYCLAGRRVANTGWQPHRDILVVPYSWRTDRPSNSLWFVESSGPIHRKVGLRSRLSLPNPFEELSDETRAHLALISEVKAVASNLRSAVRRLEHPQAS